MRVFEGLFVITPIAMLADLLFTDNPWWFDREVPPPSKILPLFDFPGVHRLWTPAGGVSSEDLKGMAYGWSKRWGKYSALFLDLSRVEMSPADVEGALDFYFSRLHSASERHLLIINAAHWISEDVLRDFIDESYTVILVHNVIPEGRHRVYLPYYPDSPSPGEVREAFWAGDVEGAKRKLAEYGKSFRRRLRSYIWKNIVGFPPDPKLYSMIRRMYSLIHEFYDIRDKELFRKAFSYLISVAGGRLKFRESVDEVGVRFETLRAFLDHMESVGIVYELYHTNRESPRAPRLIFLSNGQFHHLLKHTDPKDVLLMDEESDDILPFLLPYIIGKAKEMGVEITFEDDVGKQLRFNTSNPFTVHLGEDVGFVEIVGLV